MKRKAVADGLKSGLDGREPKMSRFSLGTETISLDDLFEAMPVAMTLVDREGRHVAFNKKLMTFSGLEADALRGLPVEQVHEQSGANIRRDFQEFDAGRDVPDHELSLNGNTYLVSVKAVRSGNGLAVGELVALTDISRLKTIEESLAAANEKLERFALEDYLTGSWNRRFFSDAMVRMSQELLSGDRQELSLIMFDIDLFKPFNDMNGHQAGDECLRHVASTLADSFKDAAGLLLCRYGGEEFSVIAPDIGAQEVLRIAEDACSAVASLRMPHRGSPEGIVTISGGISTLRPPFDETDADALSHRLITTADGALYEAKRNGRNRISVASGI